VSSSVAQNPFFAKVLFRLNRLFPNWRCSVRPRKPASFFFFSLLSKPTIFLGMDPASAAAAAAAVHLFFHTSWLGHNFHATDGHSKKKVSGGNFSDRCQSHSLVKSCEKFQSKSICF
jgi:hypothetical protein